MNPRDPVGTLVANLIGFLSSDQGKDVEQPVMGTVITKCEHCKCYSSLSGLLRLHTMTKKGVLRIPVRQCPICGYYTTAMPVKEESDV